MTPYEKLAVPFNERRKIEKKILPAENRRLTCMTSVQTAELT